MKTTVRAAVTVLLAGSVLAGAPTAFADSRTHAGVQTVLDRAVTEAGLPGAMAQVRDGSSTWFGQAGTADLDNGSRLVPQDRFRIGSTTKTFVSTVVLQLEAEHRLGLDDSVERWLPGLVDGNGYDGSKITIRQLLDHTSGIANFAMAKQVFEEFVGLPFLQHRFDGFTPRQLVELGLETKPSFAPGHGWQYSDTNYVLAGMIIEKATGHSLAQEITDRIIKPLHLRNTYEPVGDDPWIHGPHGRFYSKLMMPGDGTPFYDVTELNPSWGFGSGDIVSTVGDLGTFVQALLKGRMLPPVQQREMFTMLDTQGNWVGNNSEYGLGVGSIKLSCTTVWGMGGAIDGSWSYTFGTRDGRHLLSTEVDGDWGNGTWRSPVGVFNAEMEAEFCGVKPARQG
ncbi:serine hydrolase domain-containing protein [Streptacidiphilus jiangxiensis]|uniref:D-alanyl-D-alanine carboxypeptidase n=1 Tax=Streptacidiphilus jiangxiensis TaxID=235985 RepID=A0A1H7VQG0_STRJI|nr:serine hydrolase domain-containing protein [Streptacidiphilus jiangxiensis]SEM11254.1 D-alanyl-D-alanine carboxypeptidase [Streptacidiphilus jiangxiensis]